jgi:ABC-2 type transport system permease protein
MMQLARIAAAFCYRDFVVYARWLPGFIYSYSLQYPVLYGMCFGYLLPKIGMGGSVSNCVLVMSSGTILYALFTAGFGIASEFLMDFEGARTINYKLQFMPTWLIIAQKMIFNTLFVFMSCALYIPMLKVLFYNDFDTTHASWLQVYLILFMGCLYTTAINLFFACATTSRKSIRHFWRRVNYPMIIFGGFLVPWKAMNNFSPWLGKLVLLNPIMYVTEGLRRGLLGSENFFSIATCFGALCLATVVFVALSVVLLRRKIDAV